MAATREQAAHYQAMAAAAEDIRKTLVHGVDPWPRLVHLGDGRWGRKCEVRDGEEAQ